MNPNHKAVIAAVVVTYNRKQLLLKCLDGLLKQTHPLDKIIIMDNASTDGTDIVINSYHAPHGSILIYEKLDKNIGGAGGFAKGIALAMKRGADWIWIMDDDAEPDITALAALNDSMLNPANIYASTAACDNMLSWPVTYRLEGASEAFIALRISDLPERALVDTQPFLGFCIHRELVQTIGLPDASFFISADDIEYSLRARTQGAKLFLIKKSRISHPVSHVVYKKVLGRRIAFLSLPPWRRYYDTRNRILVARRYHGLRLWTQAVPGTLARMWFVVCHEKHKSRQLMASVAGLWDGLRGISGIRHELWRIEK